MAAKWYKRTTTGPKNGTRTTITYSSDGSIRTTLSSGPKWARQSQSFKNGRVRTTNSSNIDGWTTRTSSLSPLLNAPKRGSRRSRSKSGGISFKTFLWICAILWLLTFF